jgi:hypothetical protein
VEVVAEMSGNGNGRWRLDRYELEETSAFHRAREALTPYAAKRAADAALQVVAQRLATPVHEGGKRSDVYHFDFDGGGTQYRLLMAIGFWESRWWLLAVDVFLAPAGSGPDDAGPTPENRIRAAQEEWARWTAPRGQVTGSSR